MQVNATAVVLRVAVANLDVREGWRELMDIETTTGPAGLVVVELAVADRRVVAEVESAALQACEVQVELALVNRHVAVDDRESATSASTVASELRFFDGADGAHKLCSTTVL